MNVIKALSTEARRLGLVFTVVVSPSAFANLPTADTGHASTDGNYLNMISYYGGAMVALTALFACAWMLFRVIGNATATYGEIADGKATFKDLGIHVLSGAGIATAGIIIVTYLSSLATALQA